MGIYSWGRLKPRDYAVGVEKWREREAGTET